MTRLSRNWPAGMGWRMVNDHYEFEAQHSLLKMSRIINSFHRFQFTTFSSSFIAHFRTANFLYRTRSWKVIHILIFDRWTKRWNRSTLRPIRIASIFLNVRSNETRYDCLNNVFRRVKFIRWHPSARPVPRMCNKMNAKWAEAVSQLPSP